MFGNLMGLGNEEEMKDLKFRTIGEVDDMGSSDDADASNQLSVNERNNSRIRFRKYPIGALMLKGTDLQK